MFYGALVDTLLTHDRPAALSRETFLVECFLAARTFSKLFAQSAVNAELVVQLLTLRACDVAILGVEIVAAIAIRPEEHFICEILFLR